MFARGGAPESFARYVARRLPPGQRSRLRVGHADAAADGERLLAALQARLPVEQAMLTQIGAGIGAHAGPGALVVAVQPVAA